MRQATNHQSSHLHEAETLLVPAYASGFCVTCKAVALRVPIPGDLTLS